LAEKGHKVCIADISDRMLAIANEENYKAGLNDQIEVINSSIQELPFKLAGQKYDLVLLHGVIAWMQRPFEAISSILPLLRSGGKFSVLYFNKDKLLLKNAINGIDLSEKQEKRKLKKKRLLTPVNPISWQDFSEYCNQRKLKILCKTGVRIFYHFFARLQIPNLPEIEKYLALELKYCRQEPFASLGEHTHCIISTKRALS
jgi:S-adenosylmethionine-dependent methyltransferase